jgi:hypothetical protein
MPENSTFYTGIPESVLAPEIVEIREVSMLFL